MVIPLAIGGTFLLVNFLCAAAALGVGFAAGVWFYGAARSPSPPDRTRKHKSDADGARRVAERAELASNRLGDLAQTVAGDVGDHAQKMKSISATLREIDLNSSGADAAVGDVLEQIRSANAELQQRLDLAERQIEAQASELRAQHSEARTDSLTKLANRRAFDDEMRRRLSEWQRKKLPFSLVLLDIDRFKQFNDIHGHQVGDAVLRSVASVLVAQSREMDVPCRYGGEEFAVILPATAGADACLVAERVRTAVEKSVTQCDGKMLKVTASLGLSQVATNDDAAALIRRADEALYKSKEAGRNCGHWHDWQKCVPIISPPATEAPAKPAEPAVGPQQTSRISFIHELKRRVTESHRFGIPLSMMHVDIPGYEAVCRSRGNAIGRQMLEMAAGALDQSLRETDLLAPHENGQFVIMLPGSTETEADQMARRMRITLSNYTIPMADGELPLNLHYGIAQLKPGETASELLARAFRGLLATGASGPRLGN